MSRFLHRGLGLLLAMALVIAGFPMAHAMPDASSAPMHAAMQHHADMMIMSDADHAHHHDGMVMDSSSDQAMSEQAMSDQAMSDQAMSDQDGDGAPSKSATSKSTPSKSATSKSTPSKSATSKSAPSKFDPCKCLNCSMCVTTYVASPLRFPTPERRIVAVIYRMASAGVAGIAVRVDPGIPILAM